MSKSKIEWTDRTWNPVRGCSRVSEGCRNCYAERIAARFSNSHTIQNGLATFDGFATITPSGPRWTGKVELIESKLTEPLHWKNPQRVFVNSMSDLFHEELPDEAIDRVFAVMALCPHITFQILTKRPERMLKYFSRIFPHDSVMHIMRRDHGADARALRWPLPNVWLGVSVEDQATADARIPLLLQTPAAIRFVSYEPALGPVDFLDVGGGLISLTGWYWTRNRVEIPKELRGLAWIIAGGESGPGARPAHPDWFKSVRDQCIAVDVAFFFKQWGEYGPAMECVPTNRMIRYGKKKTGALLDGREWKQFPKQTEPSRRTAPHPSVHSALQTK